MKNKGKKHGLENVVVSALEVLGGLVVGHGSYNLGSKVTSNTTLRALVPAGVGAGLMFMKNKHAQTFGSGLFGAGLLKFAGNTVPALAGYCGADDGGLNDLLNGSADDMSGTVNGSDDNFQISDDMSGSDGVVNGADFGREDFSE